MNAFELVNNETKESEFIFIQTSKEENPSSLLGVLVHVTDYDDDGPSDSEFIVDVYIRYDGGCHLWFNGNGFSVGDKTKNPYYTLDGIASMVEIMTGLQFVSKLAVDILKNDWHNYFVEEYKKLTSKVDLLKEYSIREVEDIDKSYVTYSIKHDFEKSKQD